jgi:hypothetical protein
MSTENELRSRVCDIARGWIGRNEADGSHREIIDIYNRGRLPGTYAMSYSDPWCAAFVSAVGMEAGLREVILPHVNCEGMIASYRLAGRWVENDAYTPQPGDLIFYDWQDSGAGDCTGGADHVGIVTAVNGQLIVAIEGNYSDSVKQRYIYADGRYVRGYAVPDYGQAADKDTPAPADPPATDNAEKVEPAPCNDIEIKLPILRQGMTGDIVKAMQGILIARGFSVGPDRADGDFGYNTRQGVLNFQRSKHLTLDGIVGHDTWAALLGVME